MYRKPLRDKIASKEALPNDAYIGRRLHYRARRNHHSTTPAICITPAGALRHHTRRNYHYITRPAILAQRPALCATAPPQTTTFADLIASSRISELPHCAHAQGQSRVRVCRTLREACAAPAAREMQTETPPKEAALARQVRQRMNRLGKPEHRARFCFFSKKKSRAGTRRFPITLEIQIPMGFNRSAASFATPKTFLQSPSFAGACTTAPAGTTTA